MRGNRKLTFGIRYEAKSLTFHSHSIGMTVSNGLNEFITCQCFDHARTHSTLKISSACSTSANSRIKYLCFFNHCHSEEISIDCRVIMLRLYKRIICNGIQNCHFHKTPEQFRIITQFMRNYGDGNYNWSNKYCTTRLEFIQINHLL